MKNTILRFFLCSSVVLFAASNAVALPFTDTTQRKLLASAKKINAGERVIKEANVVCPSIFRGSEDEFLSYVEKFSTNRRDYLLRTYKRSKKFFPKAVSILQKHNIPAEFAVLLALESGFNGNAVSSAGAVGYWQIMDEVAKEYGLRIAQKEAIVKAKKDNKKLVVKTKAVKAKPSVDDRKNFIKSTYAAAKYLRDRHRNLNGDWLLITASYNCGVGNVWDAMERTGKKNPTFWDIKNYLPAETRSYVMNFIAMNVIFKNYEKFAGNELCFKDILAKKEIISE